VLLNSAMSPTDPAMTLPPSDRSPDRSGEHPRDVGAGRADPVAREAVPYVWVMCRKQAATGSVENIRAYDDEARARADLDLAEAVSDDEFWLAAVPLLRREGVRDAANSVQRLALTWLAQGAEAEVSLPAEDPVVISPRHVRGFVSVPPEEWRMMEENGWVRNGTITAAGRAQLQD
jgi:hypothetical protein